MEFFDDTNNGIEISLSDKITAVDDQVALVTNFFKFKNYSQNDFYKSMITDLYRAITCYRMYDSIEEFLRINPELQECRGDIQALWYEFDKLSETELAEVAIELLTDI